MAQCTRPITGVSSGFGHEMTKQPLAKRDKAVNTIHGIESVDKTPAPTCMVLGS